MSLSLRGMYLWLKQLSIQSLRLPLLLMVFLGMVILTGCSGGPLSLLTGGGPKIAANVQAGKTNTQTIGQTNNVSPTVSLRPHARVDSVDQSNDTTNNYDTPPWVLLLLIVGWLAPSPNEMGRWIRDIFKKHKKEGGT